jgi:D-inositol-3-phosphate glycosyltransferase
MWTSARASGKLEVFYVEPIGGHRGMHYYDFELCLALQSLGVDVTLLTCDETRGVSIPAALQVEFPFHGIYGDASKAVRGLRYLQGLVRIGLAMERRGIPLAHFHYFHFPPVDYLCHAWLRGLGKRYVLTVHDVVPFDAKVSHLGWLRRLYHGADRIIVHARSNRDTIVQGFGISQDKVGVIPMGPYLSFAHRHDLPPSVAKQRLGLVPDAPVVMFFGQIKRVKGLKYLIRAFREVVERHPRAHLLIVGPEWKESFDPYAALVERLHLSDHVSTRIEYVPDEEVGLYFSAADVVALPYTECYQSAVLYMAYSFGRPVVASAVGGLAEVVQDGSTGLLVEPKHVEQLGAALCAVLEDAEAARTMGELGRAVASKEYGWKETARKTAEVYGQLLRTDQ